MSARDCALQQIDRKRLPGWPAGVVTAVRREPMPPPRDGRDFALAEQIVIGVVKNLPHLHHLIAHYSGRALKSVDPVAQKIIAIGLCQLRSPSRVPASAAVNEAVEQAKRFGRARAAGFINAVLRKPTRDANAPMPDANLEPARYAEAVPSHPRELSGKLADLRTAGVTVTPHEQAGLFVVEPRIAVLARWAEEGVAQVQDPTAASVVPTLEIEPGQRLLDRCCGLGTKTMQMRDILGPAGSILAADASERRCRVLRGLVERRGIANVNVAQAGMMSDIDHDAGGTFDRILIDAPCGNSGVLARRPEARYAQGAKAIESVRRLQHRILDDTAGHHRAAGRLV